MYNSEWIIETLEGRICRVEMEQERRGKKKSTFLIVGS